MKFFEWSITSRNYDSMRFVRVKCLGMHNAVPIKNTFAGRAKGKRLLKLWFARRKTRVYPKLRELGFKYPIKQRCLISRKEYGVRL